MHKQLDTTEHLYTPAQAETLAAQLRTDADGWTYIVVHDPKGIGYSYVAIEDEDGVFVGKF